MAFESISLFCLMGGSWEVVRSHIRYLGMYVCIKVEKILFTRSVSFH